MSYSAIDTIMQGTRTAGDVRGLVACGLVRQATTRIAVAGSTDSKESSICRSILDGQYPVGWTMIVLGVLDINGNLASPTDAQVNTAVVTAWTYLMASRSLA